ncbi:hypothetical protein [Shinella sumterensis]|uniref:hypothetical protein n=2 Tax=Shinella TaxID=323620 RepID=UPI001E28E184|nr:hypothetical protein [Shinella sumterensis]
MKTADAIGEAAPVRDAAKSVAGSLPVDAEEGCSETRRHNQLPSINPMQFIDRISAKGLGLSQSQWLSIYGHTIGETTRSGGSVRKRTEVSRPQAPHRIRTVSYGAFPRGTSRLRAHFAGFTGRNTMQHVDSNRSVAQVRVYDVVLYCRQQGIHEAEARKLVRLIGPFADRLAIQMNLTKRPVRFR